MFHKKKEEDIYDKCDEVKKKILNEYTLFKLYFDVEKLKMTVFNSEEREAFDNLKIDFSIISKTKNQENNEVPRKLASILGDLDNSDGEFKDKLRKLFKESAE